MAFRWAVAAWSLWPPDRNTIPGTEAGTWSSRQATVASATCSTPAWVGPSLPERTMFGLSSMPSRRTRWRRRAAKVSARVSRVAWSQRSMVWSPSISTSGSTIGTSPASWERPAKRARASALAAMQPKVGDALADADDRPPLGEPGPQVAVGGQPVGQAVEALGDLLAREAGQAGGALVDLDPGDDALAGQDLGQGGAVGGRLAQGLVVEDDAADELGRPLGGEQQLAVGAAVLLGRLDVGWT